MIFHDTDSPAEHEEQRQMEKLRQKQNMRLRMEATKFAQLLSEKELALNTSQVEAMQLRQRIAELEAWIKAANQFAWAHEKHCVGEDGGSKCTCGLDQFLGRPRPFIDSYTKRIVELEAAIHDTLAYLKDKEDAPDLGELFTQLEALVWSGRRSNG